MAAHLAREILGYRASGTTATLAEAFARPPHRLSIVPNRLVSVLQLTAQLFTLFQVLVTWLVYRALTGDGSVVTVFQVGVLCALLLSIILVNHTLAL